MRVYGVGFALFLFAFVGGKDARRGCKEGLLGRMAHTHTSLMRILARALPIPELAPVSTAVCCGMASGGVSWIARYGCHQSTQKLQYFCTISLDMLQQEKYLACW